MKNKFKCEVGLSDHTLGIGAAIAAVANGATVIEAPYFKERKVAWFFSIETEDLKKLVIETNRAWKSLGKISYGPTKEEEVP